MVFFPLSLQVGLFLESLMLENTFFGLGGVGQDLQLFLLLNDTLFLFPG